MVVIPIGLFGLWWLGWGRDADTSISLANIATAPLFVVDGFATALASLFGLATPRNEIAIAPLDWGRPLLAAGVVAGGWRLWKLGRVPADVVVAGTLALSFWLLAGANEKEGRDAAASRYVYIGVVFALMIAANLLRGVDSVAGRSPAPLRCSRSPSRATSPSSTRPTSATRPPATSSAPISERSRSPATPSTRLSARRRVRATIYVGVEAGPYLAAADEFGSPAFTDEEIAAAPEPARFAADWCSHGVEDHLHPELARGPPPAPPRCR